MRKGADPKLYGLWASMKSRCNNPRARDYAYYGGRGIKMHPSWFDDYETFIADIGLYPDVLSTLNRIDNNRGYEPGNVCWVSRKEQARNRPAYNKLNMAIADAIRAEYKTGDALQTTLAAKYNIKQGHVSQIIRRKCWA